MRVCTGNHLVHLVKDGHELLLLWLPIELGHATVPYKRSKYFGKVVASDDDGHPLHMVTFTPILTNGHLIGTVANIHQRTNHHLVVYLHSRSILSPCIYSFGKTA